MPIFEYECAKCKKTFELLVSSNSSARIKCPFCSSSKVTKLFSAFRVCSGKTGSSEGGKTSSACTTCTSKTCDTCG